MKSIPQTFLGFAIPAWWRWLFVSLCPLLLWFFRLEEGNALLSRLAQAVGFETRLPGEPALLPFLLGCFWLTALLFLVLSTRRLPAPEIVIGRDGLELFDGKSRREVLWRDIVLQDGDALDVREETIGQGKSQYRVIRMDVRNGRQREPLRLCHHLNPAGRIAPSFLNQSALRRELLVTLLRARPELRVDIGIYALCEVDPVNLAPSRRAKFVFHGIMAVAFAVFGASGYFYATHLLNQPSGLLVIFGGIVFAILCTLLALVFLTWSVERRLLIDPQSPEARAARRKLLGPDTANPPRAADYPLHDPADPMSGLPPATSARRRCIDALLAGAALPEECTWEALDGDAWYLVLDARPELAEHCFWEKLDGEAWALLLPEHPEWAQHCPWEKLAAGDWADLIGYTGQFDARFLEHGSWQDFDGSDWAGLLASRPELLEHCDLARLDAEDWEYLLMFQPALAAQRPQGNTARSAKAR